MTTQLSDDLRSVYELEITLGNEVVRIEEPAGSECPLAIIFARPLHLNKIAEAIKLSPTVRYWESRDPHYPIQSGFVCEQTRHVIAAPAAGT